MTFKSHGKAAGHRVRIFNSISGRFSQVDAVGVIKITESLVEEPNLRNPNSRFKYISWI